VTKSVNGVIVRDTDPNDTTVAVLLSPRTARAAAPVPVATGNNFNGATAVSGDNNTATVF
jgi:hypothetical protein